MKNLTLILILISITACGGGGGKDEPIAPVEPVEPVIFYTYKVARDGDTRSFNGRGVKVNDILYAYPTTLANSEFVAVGEIINDSETRLFSYIGRTIIADFVNGDTSGYSLEVFDGEIVPTQSLSLLDGQWNNHSSAGQFGDTVLSLTYDSGKITGSDSKNCVINGEAYKLDGVIGVHLNLSLCDDSGDYYGALTVESNSIRGAVTSENRGISLNFTKG